MARKFRRKKGSNRAKFAQRTTRRSQFAKLPNQFSTRRLLGLLGGCIAAGVLFGCLVTLIGIFAIPSTKADAARQRQGPPSKPLQPPGTRIRSKPAAEPYQLTCGQDDEQELGRSQSATWSFRGQPGDLLSVAVSSEAGQFTSQVTLDQAGPANQVSRQVAVERGSDLPQFESFLIPQEAEYSLTVMGTGEGGSVRVELACGGQATPQPSPTPLQSPTPTPQPLDLPTALPGIGDLQVTLRWGSTEDLDLHVIDPRGEEIWFSNPRSLTGGRLESEANGSCSRASETPSETVFWDTGVALPGRYEVVVEYYGACGGASSPQAFEISVWLHGQLHDRISGSVSLGEKLSILQIDY